MPIFKTSSGYIYFSHIPKCAGTSIENYINGINNNSIFFLDRTFNSTSPLKEWSSSSPQHILGDAIPMLFGKKFFSEYFAVLRDPLERFKSAFFFQFYKQKTLRESKDINHFIIDHLTKNYLKQGWCDNHFQPQTKFLIPEKNYNLFLMNKKGMKNLKKFLDTLLLHESFEKEFPKDNILPKKFSKEKDKIILNENSIGILNKLYKNDFDLIKKIEEDNYSGKKQFCISNTYEFKIKDKLITAKDKLNKSKGVKFQLEINKLESESTKNIEEEIAKLKNIIKLNKQFINELQIINQNLKLDNEEYLRDKINYDQIINKNNNSLKNKILRKLKNKVLNFLFKK